MTMTAKVHGLYPAVKVGEDYIYQITSMRIPPGIRRMLLADGIYNLFTAVEQQDPRIQFTTTAIAAALAIAGAEGVPIVAATNELDVWLRRRTIAGKYTSGAAHVQITGHNGILYPQAINADQAGASIDYEFVPYYDGTNEPLVKTPTSSLSGSPTIAEAFVAGPVSINGTALEGIQSISVAFNIVLDLIFAEGGVWATFLDIASIQPIVRLRTMDALSIVTFGLSGLAQNDTDSEVYLRAVDKNGMREADATAAHIKIAIDDGTIEVSDISADPRTPYNTEVVITPTYDGTALPLAITTGQAIT